MHSCQIVRSIISVKNLKHCKLYSVCKTNLDNVAKDTYFTRSLRVRDWTISGPWGNHLRRLEATLPWKGIGSSKQRSCNCKDMFLCVPFCATRWVISFSLLFVDMNYPPPLWSACMIFFSTLAWTTRTNSTTKEVGGRREWFSLSVPFHWIFGIKNTKVYSKPNCFKIVTHRLSLSL